MRNWLLTGFLMLTAGSLWAAQPVVEIKFGSAVENRDVVGEAETFAADAGSVIGWTRITGFDQPGEVRHVWFFDGKEIASLTLPVRSSPYRTWSQKDVSGRVGEWRLEVRDAEGTALGSKTFTVTEPSEER